MAGDSAKRERVRATLHAHKRTEPPPYFDTPGFAARVGAALVSLHEEYLERYRAREAAGTANLRLELQRLADAVVGSNFELNTLTDPGILHALLDVCRPRAQAWRPL